MESLPQESPAACPLFQTTRRENDTAPASHYVVIVFKQRRYDGSRKIWAFSGIHAIAIVCGRLHLTREGYGLVFDMPYEEVEQVYTVEDDKALYMASSSLE